MHRLPPHVRAEVNRIKSELPPPVVTLRGRNIQHSSCLPNAVYLTSQSRFISEDLPASVPCACTMFVSLCFLHSQSVSSSPLLLLPLALLATSTRERTVLYLSASSAKAWRTGAISLDVDRADGASVTGGSRSTLVQCFWHPLAHGFRFDSAGDPGLALFFSCSNPHSRECLMPLNHRFASLVKPARRFSSLSVAAAAQE